MGLLSAIPFWAWLVGALAMAGGWQKFQASRAQSKLAAQELVAERSRGDALHAGVLEVNRRLTKQQEAANAADLRARRASADKLAADNAAGKLRDYASRLAGSAAACDPAAAPVGSPAGAPAVVLADMLGRVEARGRELAAEADRRGTAGEECQRRYDALMP